MQIGVGLKVWAESYYHWSNTDCVDFRSHPGWCFGDFACCALDTLERVCRAGAGVLRRAQRVFGGEWLKLISGRTAATVHGAGAVAGV
jgi:hypothetical protein